MALQQINWTQIDTSNVPSGSIIDLGAVSGALHAVYAENLYADGILVSGQTLGQIISDSGTAEINIYTASLKDALETTGSNLTVKGNLLVKGTTTAINSTTVAIGDNVIELNGTATTNGGLLIKDPTAPNTVSGSLLWDTTLDYWKAGPLGSEERLIRQNEYTNLSSSLSASIANLKDTSIWQPTGSFFATTNDLQVTGSLNMSGSVRIKGDLIVEGKTTLIQNLDPSVESLVVSGAMSIVQNRINSQVVAASLTIQNLGTWADRSNNSIIDCGDGFF
jgi:hypothetical protein